MSLCSGSSSTGTTCAAAHDVLLMVQWNSQVQDSFAELRQFIQGFADRYHFEVDSDGNPLPTSPRLGIALHGFDVMTDDPNNDCAGCSCTQLQPQAQPSFHASRDQLDAAISSLPSSRGAFAATHYMLECAKELFNAHPRPGVVQHLVLIDSSISPERRSPQSTSITKAGRMTGGASRLSHLVLGTTGCCPRPSTATQCAARMRYVTITSSLRAHRCSLAVKTTKRLAGVEHTRECCAGYRRTHTSTMPWARGSGARRTS